MNSKFGGSWGMPQRAAPERPGWCVRAANRSNAARVSRRPFAAGECPSRQSRIGDWLSPACFFPLS
jgi:hypothetical protein